YAYYGQKCFAFLFGTARQKWYVFAYLMIVFLTALVSVRAAIGLSDAAFAMMAIPTMISTILLAHKVPKMMAEYYFWRSQRERSQDPSQ
ncbi:MAG: sodium/alanine symporter, partial [Chloroflexi bacterium]